MRKKRKEGKEESSFRDPERPRISPMHVQQKEFRLAFRGYNERDVDGFLDEITEEIGLLLEENQRLRQGLPAVPPAGSGSATIDEARREAADIVASAREEAAGILREAEARAAVAGIGGSDAQAISPFIRTEREFLQSLAGLIQGHAESVKEMVRLARETRLTEHAASPAPEPAQPAASSEPVPVVQPVSLEEEEEVPAQPEEEVPAQPEASPWETVVEAAKQPAPGKPILGPDRVTIVEEVEVETGDLEDAEASEDDEEAVPAADEAESAPVGAEPAGSSEERDPSLRDLFWRED